MTGIGFLGAGAIIREGGRIAGLTTAATIWLSAALGMGIGGGELVFVGASTVVVLIILFGFPYLEGWIDGIREARTYRLTIPAARGKTLDKIHEAVKTHTLTVLEYHQTKTENSITGTWRTIGSPNNHEKFVHLMLKEKDVKELVY